MSEDTVTPAEPAPDRVAELEAENAALRAELAAAHETAVRTARVACDAMDGHRAATEAILSADECRRMAIALGTAWDVAVKDRKRFKSSDILRTAYEGYLGRIDNLLERLDGMESARFAAARREVAPERAAEMVKLAATELPGDSASERYRHGARAEAPVPRRWRCKS